MKTPTVSIDLGASYTKVAYRTKLTRDGHRKFATADTKSAIIEGTATIPSVMIQTTDRKRPWIAGMDAANTTPSDKMKVFENWKSKLYSSAFNADKVDLVFVAGNFFKWLLDELDKLGLNIESECRVRVTIPALKQIEEQKDALVCCMRRNGWPENIEVVLEPKANILGVLSAGRNVVSASGQISYQPTYGNAEGKDIAQLNYIFNAMRQYAREARQERYMKVSVADFGSFTLDVASMALDLRVIDHDTFPVDSVDAQSWNVGVIEDIDKHCFAELFARYDLDGTALNFGIKESAKMALYAGEAYTIPLGDRRITLGDSAEDKRIVDNAIADYCHRAWAKISSHSQDAEVVILTGGGTCISSVREFFHDKLTRKGVKKVVDFAAEGTDVRDRLQDGLCAWSSVGEGLGRLATGLGGASIGLGFVPDEACRRFIPRGTPL